MRKRKLRFILCFFLILVAGIPSVASNASSGIRLNYDGQTVIYKDKQVKYRLDGKTIKLNSTPGIIINGYSLVSYQDVFQNGMGAVCKYNPGTGTITIKKFNRTVKLTIGSRTAYINGSKTTAPLAPRKVTYVSRNTTKILVPARFVAEALGYTYQWYANLSRVDITSPYQVFYDGSWHLYDGTKVNVTVDGAMINTNGNPGILLDNTALVFAKRVFTSKGIGASYSYEPSEGKVTIAKDSVTIEFILGSQTARVNGIEQVIPVAPRIIKNNESKKAVIMIPAAFTAETLGLNYNWNKTTKISEISSKSTASGSEETAAQETVVQKWESSTDLVAEGYSNLTAGLSYIKKGKLEILRLEGKIPVTAFMTPEEGNPDGIILNLPGMQNTLGEIAYQAGDDSLINTITITEETQYSTVIRINKNNETQYYAQASGNSYEIVFSGPTSSEYALRIKMPEAVSFSEIEDEDKYYNNQFIITLPGDYTEFYDQNPIEILKDNIIMASYDLDKNGDTKITITTSSLQGYRLSEKDGYVCIDVGNPSEIYDKIVLLDPGHGGDAVGTVSASGKYEKDATFAILYTYIKPYFTDKASTVKAYWTRTAGNENPGLYDRAAMAEEMEADIFISLHMNSGPSSANGTETYYSKNNNKAGFSGLTSQKLASFFQDKLPGMLGLSGSRGVKTNTFVVINKNTVPAILIELGFFSNPSDFKKLSNPDFQKEAAGSIYELTEQLFEQYPTGR